MPDVAIDHPQTLRNHLIDIIGETVEGQGTRLKRIAAKEIIERDRIMFNPRNRDALLLEIADLIYRLERYSIYFASELVNEPVRYSAEGIPFRVLVRLVRLEEDFVFSWGWLPEQVHGFGRAIHPGEEPAGLSGPDSYSIRDREGNLRE